MDDNRSKVPRRTSYRVPEPLARREACASCGDPFLIDEPKVYESDPAWGDVPMPVHEVCSIGTGSDMTKPRTS